MITKYGTFNENTRVLCRHTMKVLKHTVSNSGKGLIFNFDVSENWPIVIDENGIMIEYVAWSNTFPSFAEIRVATEEGDRIWLSWTNGEPQ